MATKNKLANAQAILKNLKGVIDDIKDGNIEGSRGRKIIDLVYHHHKIPAGLHLDDYFVETFSAMGYYLMNYHSSEKKEVALAEAMISELGTYAGKLLVTLLNQAQGMKEYVPHSQEFTANMHQVWESKFKPLCDFLQQFVNLRYGRTFNAYSIDMKTPITKETITFELRRLGLLA